MRFFPPAVLLASLSLAASLPALMAADVPAAPAAPVPPAATGIDESKIKCMIDESKIKRMPWHLGDMWWDIGEAATKEEFQSLELDFDVKGKVADGVNLYIAPTGGSGGVEGQDFYGGIQTNTGMCRTRAEPAESQRRFIGRAAIFSTWKDRDLASIQTSENGYFDSSGHEGDFISVRHKLQWGEGRYTYRICRLRTEYVDGKPRAWVGAFVLDHQSGEETQVGSLRLQKGEHLHLTRRLSAFVEIYGGKKPLAQLPFGLEVTFFVPRINGKVVPEPHAAEQFDPGLPDLMTISPVNAKGEALAKPKPAEVAGMRFKLGTEPVRREKRFQWLF